MTDAPSDWERQQEANRAYYANMPTRRYRVTLDVDVECRPDHPDMAANILGSADLPLAVERNIRFRNAEVVTFEATPLRDPEGCPDHTYCEGPPNHHDPWFPCDEDVCSCGR